MLSKPESNIREEHQNSWQDLFLSFQIYRWRCGLVLPACHLVLFHSVGSKTRVISSLKESAFTFGVEPPMHGYFTKEWGLYLIRVPIQVQESTDPRFCRYSFEHITQRAFRVSIRASQISSWTAERRKLLQSRVQSSADPLPKGL